MGDFQLSYREVIPDQTNPQIWKDITLNTGATQSTLQDIKVAEKAGGYYYKDTAKANNRNRFIYWRTNRDILELSEISLDYNLVNANIRYKFTDSPVLAVTIAEHGDQVLVSVATISSVHLLKFPHPNRLQQKSHDDTQAFAIFHEATVQQIGARDQSLFHVIGHAATPNHPIPHTAACWLSANGQDAYFSLAYQTNLMLFHMHSGNGQTTSVELKEQYIVPRIFSNITGALRGKGGAMTDSQYATSLIFNELDDVVFLYGLYRDDNVRMWSSRSGQCVATVNCVQNIHEQRLLGSQTNTLRRASSTLICAFLCASSGSEFVTIRTINDGGNYTMHRLDLVPAPEFDLVEFDVNENRIWGLWCNSQGEFNVSSYSLVANNSCDWITAGLENLPEHDVKVEQGIDPRQAFCSYIFYPGRFQRDVIDKALIMFRRSNILSDPNVPLSVLRDRVCYAVEQEVQNELKDFDITDELYIDTSFKYWERFYSCCEQYHIKSCQPIGIVSLDTVGALAVVKKNSFSLLRPIELLEHLMLVGENIEPEHLADMTFDEEVFTSDDVEDLVKLVSILFTIEHKLSEEDKAEIDTKLYELEMPSKIIKELVTDILSREYEQNIFPRAFLLSLNQQIKQISQQTSVVMVLLLKLLRMDDGQPEAMQAYAKLSQSSHQLLSMSNLFRSNIGISFLAESLRQNAIVRYSMCRNLLILQRILIDSSDLQCNTLEVIRSRCMPETEIFLQSYYVMVWMCETAAVPPSPAALDASIQRLGGMQLTDARYKVRTTNPTTILEQFLRGRGAITGLSLLMDDAHCSVSEINWQYTLVPLVNIIGQLIWAVSGNFVFGEWLMGSCQHVLIQEYVRLLSGWCEWNKFSRNFISAVSLLDTGEPHKAYDRFVQFTASALEEPFLEKIILDAPRDELTVGERETQYYLKVIQLFEQHSALDCVIQFARMAMDQPDRLSPSQLAMFHSIVFTNYLELEHYQDAYHALIDNTDESRRRDCLRQLVVRLFERRRIDLLMNFPYIGLHDDLESIVESRARSMAIENNAYYDFLYAFHVSKSGMRRAAAIMYEQAMRFGLECDTLSAIERRYECLLTCLTTLHLVDEKYRWIARPVINDEPRATDRMDVDVDAATASPSVTVLELRDVRRELLLTDAVIALTRHRKELAAILNADADELIAVLANVGLYTTAVKLAREHDRCVSNVLQSLAFVCTQASDDNANDTWAWLQENDLADLPHKNSAKDMAWRLLQHLIGRNERDGETRLHKAVAAKILSLGEFLPHWLCQAYRRRHPVELLNLYVKNGRLIEASELAMEYVSAMMATGGEYFGLTHAIHLNRPPMCFPINTIDMLLHSLQLNATHDGEYREQHDQLQAVVQQYVHEVELVSNNKIEYATVA